MLDQTAAALSSQSQSPEDDLVLAREASAFYLKLSESVLREVPGNLPLAASVAAGFTQYAYAFVALEADKREPQDAAAAQQLRERAARLYARAHRHAMAALEASTPGFTQSLGRPDALQAIRLTTAQVPVAYWAAASWGGWISLSKDNPDIVADLPTAIQLAKLAWLKQPDFSQGALSSLMGTFEAARPGGSAAQAAVYFEQAVVAGAGQSAGVYVAQAESLALPKGDRASFEALLHKAVQVATLHRNLPNDIMRERATWLLGMADDLF
ncbi:TRAP transporter TatT component family protein [Limnohabitans sp.]|uniref:TRAP transporter TatT component family protein n=1 Tax=Limnohabitans sp. TaxID=1907725 RepID=UPI0038BCD9C9